MGMDLEPINPTKEAPETEEGGIEWGRYNWNGWTFQYKLLNDWGVDTSELSRWNDGAEISKLTCLKIADAIEKHLNELSEEDRKWLKPKIILWRTCGGYRQW